MMGYDFKESLGSFFQSYLDYLIYFSKFLAQPSHRFFILFIISSLAIAFFLYHRRKESGGFLSFLFPASVWSNPAAWLDVRYFFFHGLIGHFLLFGFGVTSYFAGLFIGMGFVGDDSLAPVSPFSPTASFLIAGAFLIIITFVNSFITFYLHYLQHKIPLLWQFHKVHHSGEVMHPLSNYREHPVDNLTYKLFGGLGTGLASGVMLRFIGYTPTSFDILGLSIFMLGFNVGAYHLRHSHIWLKWPGIWSKVFASPAHHHVHHSRHPDHLDKNFAFLFPFWDVLFGCYHMPEDNRDVEFGIVEDATELNSCVNLYLIPFRDAYRLLNTPKTAASEKIIEAEI